jgi:hypothetical protein
MRFFQYYFHCEGAIFIFCTATCFVSNLEPECIDMHKLEWVMDYGTVTCATRRRLIAWETHPSSERGTWQDLSIWGAPYQHSAGNGPKVRLFDDSIDPPPSPLLCLTTFNMTFDHNLTQAAVTPEVKVANSFHASFMFSLRRVWRWLTVFWGVTPCNPI